MADPDEVTITRTYGIDFEYTSHVRVRARDGCLCLERDYAEISFDHGLIPYGIRTETMTTFESEEIDFGNIEVTSEQGSRPMLDGSKLPDDDITKLTIPLEGSNAHFVVEPKKDPQTIIDALAAVDPSVER
jgi:hypothetical protein